MPSNKSFGIVFSVFFLILTLYYFFNNSLNLASIFLILSILFFVLGLNNSKVLTPFNSVWTKFGFLLGKFVSPIIIGFIYFFVIFPTKLFLVFLKKDNLMLNDKLRKTYWKAHNNDSNMNNQF